jgi:hypothetical protein
MMSEQSLKNKIAQIIDPAAFMPSRHGEAMVPSMSQRSALAKAEKILALIEDGQTYAEETAAA